MIFGFLRIVEVVVVAGRVEIGLDATAGAGGGAAISVEDISDDIGVVGVDEGSCWVIQGLNIYCVTVSVHPLVRR